MAKKHKSTGRPRSNTGPSDDLDCRASQLGRNKALTPGSEIDCESPSRRRATHCGKRTGLERGVASHRCSDSAAPAIARADHQGIPNDIIETRRGERPLCAIRKWLHFLQRDEHEPQWHDRRRPSDDVNVHEHDGQPTRHRFAVYIDDAPHELVRNRHDDNE